MNNGSGMVSRSFHLAKLREISTQLAKSESSANLFKTLHEERGKYINQLEAQLEALKPAKTKVYSADSKGNPKVYLV